MDRVGSDRPPEGETAWKSAGPDWSVLGRACEEREMGRGPLAGGQSGSPGTAAAALWVAVLAPGRRSEGRNGRR
ncbi:hypothetical protein CDL15_Pgr006394 [Punica granatum]|nr:hypothetical protein CDL15_Pgr006394 [Punica granatum]